MQGISRHRVTVELAGRDEPVELVTANPDLIQWDETRARKGWPSMTEAHMLWMTFIAWAAARRTGVYTDGWDRWREDCLDIAMDAVEEVDPTKPGHVPG